MYCKECGVENSFDTGNCLECGTALTEPTFAKKRIKRAPSRVKQRTKIRSEGPGDALRTAGISFGALSLILFCQTFAGVIFGIAGLILGILGKREGEQAGLADMSNNCIIIPAVAVAINLSLIILNAVLQLVWGVNFQLHVIDINFRLL
jgi:hypothetical protein